MIVRSSARLSALAVCAGALCLAASAFPAAGQAAGEPPTPSDAAQSSAPPPPGAARSPVDVFRELLSLDEAGRLRQLASRPPDNRERILAKVREYEALTPSERELRLRVTELRWYLWPLLNNSGTNREAQVAAVPPEYRRLVQERLAAWDTLNPEFRQDLLENDLAMRYFTDLAGGRQSPASPPASGDPPPPPAVPASLEPALARWQQLPGERRHLLIGQFRQFFELTAPEQTRALRTLSEVERRELQSSLAAFKQLSREQRAQAIQSFDKFASLSPAERLQFLRNAERWRLMSPEERQQWREVVNRLPPAPPLPTELPPLPAGRAEIPGRNPPATIATNH